MKQIKDYTPFLRNPLGIIGLFVTVSYSTTSITFGVVNKGLHIGVQYILAVFVSTFPVIILCVFYRLVSKYHLHLYAPSDLRDERLFYPELRQQTPEEKSAKLKQELDESDEDSTEYNVNDDEEITDTQSSKTENETSDDRSIENIRQQMKRRLTTIKTDDVEYKLSQYYLAEDLALKEYAKETDEPIRRDVKIGNIGYDGFQSNGHSATFIEVKYTQGRFSFKSIRKLYEKILSAKNMYIGLKPKLVVIFVIEERKTEQYIRESLKVFLREYKTDVPVEAVFYEFDELKFKHGLKLYDIE